MRITEHVWHYGCAVFCGLFVHDVGHVIEKQWKTGQLLYIDN